MKKVYFSKMQGAGNDFVVIDETQGLLGLTEKNYRFLADRRFGVGADQILSVRPGRDGADFEYVIHNADGGEVEQCGNGARCFARYVVYKGLTSKTTIKVLTRAGMIEPTAHHDGSVTVNMGEPIFDHDKIPFVPPGAPSMVINTHTGKFEKYQLPLDKGDVAEVSVVSMGNPHAVKLVGDVSRAAVSKIGPQIERHVCFPRRVNAGFMQVVNRGHIKLRVYERGAGETLACGTGACAAVVVGIRLGLLDDLVRVDTHGGVLHIQWSGLGQPVMMTGPAVLVFDGEIVLPD